MNIPALVLAAGRGSRLGAAAGGLPKPLVPVAGTPLLFWNLEWLSASGIRDVWINLHHGAEAIREAVGDASRWSLHVRWSPEPELLGTAGAWKRLERAWTGASVVVYGDNLMRFDLTALVAAHRRCDAPATIAVFDPDAHANTGIAGGRVRVDAGRVTDFREGAPAADRRSGDYVNAGVYVLEPDVAVFIEPGSQDFGVNVLPRLARAGGLVAHVIEPGGFCLGVDTPERLRIAEHLVCSGRVRPRTS